MMRFLLLIAAFLLNFNISASASTDSGAIIPMPIEQINSAMSMIQKRVRDASVRVMTPGGGHGSGSYIQYKDMYFIFTAQHVSDGVRGTKYQVLKGSESRLATLVWSDADADMAVLLIEKKFTTITPMKWDPQVRIAEVGTDITYSGYPSSHQLMTFGGTVAGYEDKQGVGLQIILNTYGWFGCSGSVVYSPSGEIVGILYGVDVEYYPGMQVQENLVWVVPIQRVSMKVVLKNACSMVSKIPARLPKACR